MARYKKVFLTLLLLMNIMVLMGQVYPAGAPPFARVVNILFLCLTLLYFIGAFLKRGNPADVNQVQK